MSDSGNDNAFESFANLDREEQKDFVLTADSETRNKLSQQAEDVERSDEFTQVNEETLSESDIEHYLNDTEMWLRKPEEAHENVRTIELDDHNANTPFFSNKDLASEDVFETLLEENPFAAAKYASATGSFEDRIAEKVAELTHSGIRGGDESDLKSAYAIASGFEKYHNRTDDEFVRDGKETIIQETKGGCYWKARDLFKNTDTSVVSILGNKVRREIEDNELSEALFERQHSGENTASYQRAASNFIESQLEGETDVDDLYQARDDLDNLKMEGFRREHVESTVQSRAAEYASEAYESGRYDEAETLIADFDLSPGALSDRAQLKRSLNSE
jgi:hypothetical protein